MSLITAPWRASRAISAAYVDATGRLLADSHQTEAFAMLQGRLLTGYLTITMPVQQAAERWTTAALADLGAPTRGDVLSIAQRMTHVELLLDDMDAKLDTLAVEREVLDAR